MLIHGPRLAQLEHRAEHISTEVNDAFDSIVLTVSDWYRSFNDINVTRTLWLEHVNTTFLPLVAQAYDDSATDTWEKLNTIGDEAQRTLTAAIIPRIVSNLAESFLEGAKQRLVAIGDVLWNAMRLQLLQGLQFGEGLDKLRDRLVAAARDAGPRARNTAQTEIIGASNAGSYQQMKAAQVVALKTWVARDDDRTRSSHREVDGTRVDMNTKFIVGGYALDYPHDPTAPAGEVYGCRCTLVWNVVREGQLTDELVIQSLAADAFHLPGKHEQKNHGRRYKTPGDKKSGLRERTAPAKTRTRATQKEDTAPEAKPVPVKIEVRPPAKSTPTLIEPDPAPEITPEEVITPPPVVTPVDVGRAAGTPATQRMLDAYDAGYTVIDRFDPGASNAKIDLLELSDGTRAVRKADPSGFGNDNTTRAEYLSGLVLNAVGIDDVHTAQLSDNAVLTTYVPGPTGSRAAGVELQKVGHAYYNEKLDELMLEQAQTSGGKSIGLADWLTDNTDRHSLNWIMTDDGARPIDQGKSRFIASLYPDGKGNLKETVPVSPFTEYWLGLKTDKYSQLKSLKPKFTRAELTEYRERINGLREEFNQPGEDKFFDSMIRRLDMVEAKVKK